MLVRPIQSIWWMFESRKHNRPYNNRWCTSYRYMDRQQTVGLTSGPVSHVQSPRMSRSNENNIAQVTGEDCPQNRKFWRKAPERGTYLRGKKRMRDGSLTSDHAKKKKRPLPDVAHAADRAAYPSRTTVKVWCGPVEAIRRNSSLAETSLTYPSKRRIEALDSRHQRRWRYEKSIQGVKRTLLKKTKVIFILVAVHAARSATNVVFFFRSRVPT